MTTIILNINCEESKIYHIASNSNMSLKIYINKGEKSHVLEVQQVHG